MGADQKLNHYAFFQNRDCEYFPCHKTDSPEEFNCLFCYCPLYMLDDRCGGNFCYTPKGYKDCSGCLLPHVKSNYDYVTGQFQKIADQMAENRRKD